jgi:hypothetical protein
MLLASISAANTRSGLSARFLHRSVTRTSLVIASPVPSIGKNIVMKIFEISNFFMPHANPETNRDIRVVGENLPLDFLTHKPRISMKARQTPSSELHLLKRAGFLSISA